MHMYIIIYGDYICKFSKKHKLLIMYLASTVLTNMHDSYQWKVDLLRFYCLYSHTDTRKVVTVYNGEMMGYSYIYLHTYVCIYLLQLNM